MGAPLWLWAGKVLPLLVAKPKRDLGVKADDESPGPPATSASATRWPRKGT